MTGIWVWRDLHRKRDPSVRSGRGNRAWDGVRGGRGGLARRRSLACGVLGPRARDKDYKLAQTIEATVLVLTGVCFGSEMPRGMVVGEVRAAALGRGRRRVDAVVLWAC